MFKKLLNILFIVKLFYKRDKINPHENILNSSLFRIKACLSLWSLQNKQVSVIKLSKIFIHITELSSIQANLSAAEMVFIYYPKTLYHLNEIIHN